MVSRRSKTTRQLGSLYLGLLLIPLTNPGQGAEPERPTNQIAKTTVPKPLAAVLTPKKWQQVEKTVDRALSYLALRQAADGSFPSLSSAQPAVTSLCVMAFLSRGHQPGHGPYGELINRGIDFVLSCQQPDGLLCYERPGPLWQSYEASHTASYNHGIAGLMLGEVYGQVTDQRAQAVKQTIEKALKFTRQLQLRRKAADDTGGWRYLRIKPNESDSDLSITTWQLMFMRSARNAEFQVPQEYVTEAIAYVRRCWDPESGMFRYKLSGYDGSAPSRGMTGAGILSLSMAGQHQTPMAQMAGDWLLAHPYRHYMERIGDHDKPFYSMYYCSQAMAQLGGRYWEGFFPPMVQVLLSAQSPDGSWPPEPYVPAGVFGNALTTAFAVLALTPPYQLLPVYQR